jgi:hypothetical protein
MRNLGIQFFVGVLGLTLATAAQSPFAGTWEAEINDQPGIDLTIDHASGKISGKVVFYFQLRGEDGRWRVADKHTVTMLAPHVEGKILAFEVLHHKTHGSSELGPNAKFRMELTGANEAVLRKTDDQSQAGKGVRLRRK